MDLNRRNLQKLALLVAFGILLNFSLQHFSLVQGAFGWIFGILGPFILGSAIAFILNVPMRFLERIIFSRLDPERQAGKMKKKPSAAGTALWRMKRPLSLVLTLVLVLGVIFVVIFMIVPELGNTIGVLQKVLPGFYQDVQQWIVTLSEQYPEAASYLLSLQIDWQQLVQSVFDFIRNSGIFSSAFGAASSIVNGLVSFFVGFVFAIYLLVQKEKLAQQLKKLLYAFLPEKRVDRVVEVAALSSDTFSRFLSGQCLEAMILGLMFFITMTILQFPYALLIGLLVAFTALIPIFGAFLGCAVGAFLILMVNPMQALWFILLFLILQQVEGNLIYPKVVGGSIGLPSIWVLAAVTVGGSMMGIAGMLIFIPLCSVVYTLLRETVYRRLKEKGKTVGCTG